MESILEKLILVTLGGIIGSYITSRLDILKAWRAYVVIRAEVDRNLKLLKNAQESLAIDYSSSDNDQQEQIDEMIDSFEDRIPSIIISKNESTGLVISCVGVTTPSISSYSF
jgi:hypothetical protein